ncbi:MAG: tRNA-dihydrouridine synthase [bacterium]
MSAPLELPCGLRIHQRVGFAPLTNTQSHADGTLSHDEFEWLLRRAQGGFEWLSTCATYVSDDGKAWQGQLGIATDAHIAGLQPLTARLREFGAKPIMQLHHGGPMANQAPRGPVAATERPGVRAASIEELELTVQTFANAARRAERAGFSGVELHGANGYLFTNFLSPVENQRTDAYGAGLAGRAKLIRDAMRAVREVVSPTFAVGVRLSPIDVYANRGLTSADTLQVATWLCEDGADFIHLSLADAACADPLSSDGKTVASIFRNGLPANVPVLAAGGIWTQSDLRRAHDVGVDIGVIGTAAIIHPDWPRASLLPNWEPQRLPVTVEVLRAAGAGQGMIDYLLKRPGFVVGGTPRRM